MRFSYGELGPCCWPPRTPHIDMELLHRHRHAALAAEGETETQLSLGSRVEADLSDSPPRVQTELISSCPMHIVTFGVLGACGHELSSQARGNFQASCLALAPSRLSWTLLFPSQGRMATQWARTT